MILVFLGPPGSGKGTQAKKLCANRQWLHLSTGDLLRAEIQRQSPLGKEIQALTSSGQFVSDALIVQLVSEFLKENSGQSAVLDGFPRTLNQAELFETEVHHGIDAVIEFSIEPQKLIDRLTHRFSCETCGALYNDVSKPTLVADTCDNCGGHTFIRRTDDRKEVVQERLNVYERQTKPLIDYYAQKKILHSIKADLDINTIKEQLHTVVDQLCNPSH